MWRRSVLVQLRDAPAIDVNGSLTALVGDALPFRRQASGSGTILAGPRIRSGRRSSLNAGARCLHIQIRISADRPATVPSYRRHTFATFNFFPDPYVNTLRIERWCNIEAINRNCLMIGISDTACCDDDSVSPFFRGSGGGANGNDDALINSVQSIFRTLKPDMRPCTEQITVSHHPYIDRVALPRGQGEFNQEPGDHRRGRVFLRYARWSSLLGRRQWDYDGNGNTMGCQKLGSPGGVYPEVVVHN